MAETSTRRPLVSGLIIIVLLLVLFVIGRGSVNAIPKLDESVSANWAQVENQHQRRADLVPNLVATVSGAADFERATLTAVVEARAKVSQMTIPKDILTNKNALRLFEQNQGALTQALSRLLVVVERYPDIKANQSFLALQSQLEGTENRIAIARRDFIGAVRDYNTELRTIPGRWWASFLYPDAALKESFAAREGAQEVPQVKFDK
jgi:LemA protein